CRQRPRVFSKSLKNCCSSIGKNVNTHKVSDGISHIRRNYLYTSFNKFVAMTGEHHVLPEYVIFPPPLSSAYNSHDHRNHPHPQHPRSCFPRRPRYLGHWWLDVGWRG